MLHHLLHVLEKLAQYSLKKAFWVHKIWILCHLSRICLRSENTAFFFSYSRIRKPIFWQVFFFSSLLRWFQSTKLAVCTLSISTKFVCWFSDMVHDMIWCLLWHYNFLTLFSRSMRTKGTISSGTIRPLLFWQFKHGSQTSCFCCLHFE